MTSKDLEGGGHSLTEGTI